MKIFQNVIHTIKNKDSFLRHVATLISGTVIAQALSVLSSPVITRLYAPEDIGTLASVVSVVMILGVIASGRYDLAILLPEDDKDANAVFYTGVIISIIFSSIITLAFFFFGDSLQNLLGINKLAKNWLFIIGILVFFTALEQLLIRSCVRDRLYKSVSIGQVSKQFGAVSTKIGAGFLKAGVTGLFTATFLGHLIKNTYLLWQSKSRIFHKANDCTFKRIWKVAKRYKKFPLINSWSVFFNTISHQTPVILFASFFSPTVAGHYALCYRILVLPKTLIGNSVGNVFMERVSLARDNPVELSRLTLGIYKKLLLIGALFLSVFTFYGDLIFPFAFGSNWTEAGQYARWISLWIVISLPSGPLGLLYPVLERQGENLVMDFMILVSRAALFAWGFLTGIDALSLIAGFSLVSALMGFMKCFRILYIAHVRPISILFQTVLILGPVFGGQYFLSLVIRQIFF